LSDPPNFAGVNLGDNVQIFLREGTPDPNGSVVFFIVAEADELYEFHRANRVEVIEEPSDKPWHIRDYTIRDLDGNYLVFGQRLRTTEPHLKIERVDVPVRLEKRLAALLTDLGRRARGSRRDAECGRGGGRYKISAGVPLHFPRHENAEKKTDAEACSEICDAA
jgi:hypothetical protein